MFFEHKYTTLFLNCIKIKSLKRIQQVHAKVITNSLFSDAHVANLLIESDIKCGNPELAHHVFVQMPERDSLSWAQRIASYSKNKQPDKVIDFFRLMNRQGSNPDRSSLLCALNACTSLLKLIQGKQLHSQIMKRISLYDVVVGNVLIHFYTKCGELGDARRAFDEIIDKDFVSWTSMLSGCSQNGLSEDAWEFFTFMISQDMGFSHYAFAVTAKACAELRDVKAGEELHSLVIKTGFESHVFVASALLDMYSKHRKISCGRRIFDLMDEPNIVSWTSLITGYDQIDEGEEALKLFRRQTEFGIPPDAFSLSSILAVCANIPAHEFGRQVHDLVVKLGFEFQVFVGNSLLGMYSRCGCLLDAKNVHESMKNRNIVTWTSMIAGYSQHGHGIEALKIFNQMREANIKPNSITFIAVLSACSRSGLVEEGIRYFQMMGSEYMIEAGEGHYTCMVDLLSRAGLVKEAEEFIRTMPFEPSACTWSALLSACRACGNLRLGLKCAEELFRLEPQSASNHILLANMYAAEGRWEEMGRIRGLMKEKVLKKDSGYSWIEIGKDVNVFGVADTLHPLSDFIYGMVDLLTIEMREARGVLCYYHIFWKS